ncbi:hypothetical protein [Colwellia sp. Arc7-D]|uniref:hypothetical protein n=1 Tax=Colwellia sp. Arc7-D TaxID=2161872 RepID=UPI000D3B2F03|nr:hypothetical protein [Colwellia sp. Arc7-D]AWB57388.1 hypothetical protein DBO93_07360 [Colwellia sp. Arc7-D]
MPHSEKSLFQLLSFHIALWAPITIAILFSIYILNTSNLIFKSGFSGLNNAWDIFKVPLAIFSLAFPSVALITANHRSIQSKNQIELTVKQNMLKNYYDSIDDFEQYVESFTFKSNLIYRNKRVLYRKIFPLNTPKSVTTTVDKNTLIEIKIYYKNAVHNILKDIENRIYLQKNQIEYADIIVIVAELYKKLKLNWLINFGVGIDESRFKESDSVIETIHNLTNEFYSLLSYCIEYSMTENGFVISEHQSFLNSESWLEFQRKIKSKSTFSLTQIDLGTINIPPKENINLV